MGLKKRGDKWQASCRLGPGRRAYLGTFDTQEAAARAYDDCKREHQLSGPYNFPRPDDPCRSPFTCILLTFNQKKQGFQFSFLRQ